MGVPCWRVFSARLTPAVFPLRVPAAWRPPAVSSRVSLMSAAHDSQCIPSKWNSAFILLPSLKAPRVRAKPAARARHGHEFYLTSVAEYYSPHPAREATRDGGVSER